MHQNNGSTMRQGTLGQRPQTHHPKREAKQKQGELMRENTRNANREGKAIQRTSQIEGSPNRRLSGERHVVSSSQRDKMHQAQMKMQN